MIGLVLYTPAKQEVWRKNKLIHTNNQQYSILERRVSSTSSTLVDEADINVDDFPSAPTEEMKSPKSVGEATRTMVERLDSADFEIARQEARRSTNSQVIKFLRIVTCWRSQFSFL